MSTLGILIGSATALVCAAASIAAQIYIKVTTPDETKKHLNRLGHWALKLIQYLSVIFLMAAIGLDLSTRGSLTQGQAINLSIAVSCLFFVVLLMILSKLLDLLRQSSSVSFEHVRFTEKNIHFTRVLCDIVSTQNAVLIQIISDLNLSSEASTRLESSKEALVKIETTLFGDNGAEE